EPLRSPIIWLMLAILIVMYSLLLLRGRGQTASDVRTSSADLPIAFKRYFPFSNMSLLAPLDLWIARLIQARFAIGLLYVPRLVVTLGISAINTVISLPERLLFPLLLCRKKISDPVFVVGAHRSGTTHLHYLLSLDPQFTTPK